MSADVNYISLDCPFLLSCEFWKKIIGAEASQTCAHWRTLCALGQGTLRRKVSYSPYSLDWLTELRWGQAAGIILFAFTYDFTIGVNTYVCSMC